MRDLNVLAILLATVVAFVISGAYYAALGGRLARLSPAYAEPGGPAVATIAVELVRSLVVAVTVAALAAGLGLDGLAQALLLGLALWVAFPVVLLLGSVFHERVPPLLAAIHSGDWLLKLATIAPIVTIWR
jgi:hypothetical protein